MICSKLLPLLALVAVCLAADTPKLTEIPTEKPFIGEPAKGEVQSNFPSYNSYTVGGDIELPYAEIVEPFMAYFDKDGQRSRIDYYNGLAVTVQDHATLTSTKIIYRTTEEELNVRKCVKSKYNMGQAVKPQPAIPVIDSTWKKTGTEKINGVMCDKWILPVKVEEKQNYYMFWASTTTGNPVRYEMMGFDSLFGSHFDKYIINYKFFDNSVPAAKIFDVSKDYHCEMATGTTATDAISMNPMAEYINGVDDHTHEQFEDFTKQHSKNYENKADEAYRKTVFRQNLRYINSRNRAGLSYTLAMNHLSDKAVSEMSHLRGYKPVSAKVMAPTIFDVTNVEDGVPDNWDWRIKGAVTQVKDQAICGSCWSFGTVGALEGAWFLKYGERLRFSQQQLVDCSWGEGNNGCDGGEDIPSYQYVMKHGLSSEWDYGRYLAQDGKCKEHAIKPTLNVTGFGRVPSNDPTAFKKAMMKYGPLSIAIDAAHKDLSFYSSGVYYDPACSSVSLDHAVLAVGWGTLDGQDYWLVKNSWSTYWGNDGYVLMSQKNNNCGPMTAPTFVEVAKM